MESPTKEIEDFESTSLKYLQPEQIEKIWLRLRGLRKYKKTSQRLRVTPVCAAAVFIMHAEETAAACVT
ncbi:hypothetical protein SKAU_G00222920 [Synaphobranchus kaupii]|uniref:Calcium/calmodulin-dependent 3',5'-cyclic nucleotide phosphodiesterase 1C n=1 Tax=Synaphobranchus kaupii TaxID=118154 RepID=A0A9Q1FBA5_SYNKA|nr:hypothetical protein SKAU_G00222920 [Synaphobranchus kaupii]